MKVTKYPRHLRHGTIRLSDETERPRYHPSTLKQRLFTDAAMNEWTSQRRAFVRPFPNGRRDPVTISLVLDLLMRLEHDRVLRTREVIELLRLNYPQATWDPTTVGWILSEICHVAAESGAPSPRPIEKATDSQGKYFYVVHPTPANWQWMGRLRHEVGQKAARVLEDEAHRTGPKRPWNASAFADVDTSYQGT